MTTTASYAFATLGSQISSTFDCNHLFYLHPSDNPGMQLTTAVLTENNYTQWQRSLRVALSSKLKFGFVDGSYAKPAANSLLFVHWTRCDNMVTSWLLNSVSDDIRSSVVSMQSPREKARYAQSNVPKLFHLRKEIARLSQGTLSVSSYFTKFRTIHDELDCLRNKPRCVCTHCTCQVNARLVEEELSVQLANFLMGLNDTFTAIRGQILMMKPLPTLSQCYAMLVQEESQREPQGSLSIDNLALDVKTGFNNKNQSQVIVNKKGVDAVVCDFCHMPGHLKDKC